MGRNSQGLVKTREKNGGNGQISVVFIPSKYAAIQKTTPGGVPSDSLRGMVFSKGWKTLGGTSENGFKLHAPPGFLHFPARKS